MSKIKKVFTVFGVMRLSKNLHEDNFKKYWDESAQFYKLRLRVYKLLI